MKKTMLKRIYSLFAALLIALSLSGCSYGDDLPPDGWTPSTTVSTESDFDIDDWRRPETTKAETTKPLETKTKAKTETESKASTGTDIPETESIATTSAQTSMTESPTTASVPETTVTKQTESETTPVPAETAPPETTPPPTTVTESETSETTQTSAPETKKSEKSTASESTSSESSAAKSSEEPVESVPAVADLSGKHYVLNTNTKKFHYPSCDSAGRISAKNRQDYYGDRSELIASGYDPCKRCNP